MGEIGKGVKNVKNTIIFVTKILKYYIAIGTAPAFGGFIEAKTALLLIAISVTIFVILRIDPTDTRLMAELRDNNQAFNRLMHDQQERLKELACINGTTAILIEGKHDLTKRYCRNFPESLKTLNL